MVVTDDLIGDHIEDFAYDKIESLIEAFYPYMYCYLGSGMLTNDENEEVIRDYAKRSILVTAKEVLLVNKDQILWQQIKTILEAELA